MSKPTQAQIKAAVRARDGWRCVECGRANDDELRECGRSLDVHRLTPGSPYSVAGCVTLCKSCHGSKPKHAHSEAPLTRLARLVIESRKARGWSSFELSGRAGISYSSVCAIEQGKNRSLKMSTAVPLMAALGLTLDEAWAFVREDYAHELGEPLLLPVRKAPPAHPLAREAVLPAPP
jgi:transcriptional regulator with XRE-family HTH domain